METEIVCDSCHRTLKVGEKFNTVTTAKEIVEPPNVLNVYEANMVLAICEACFDTVEIKIGFERK